MTPLTSQPGNWFVVGYRPGDVAPVVLSAHREKYAADKQARAFRSQLVGYVLVAVEFVTESVNSKQRKRA